MLLGITGTDGSGKGTTVEYLVEKMGFVHCSARAIFLEELSRRGIEPTRVNLRLIANELREKRGNDFLITYYLQKIQSEGIQNAAIESIRAVAEAETLKKNGGILIAIDASPEIRYARVQERRSETDKVTYEEFLAHEELETNDPNPHGMQKRKVMALADYTILNNGTSEEFFKSIEDVFAKIAKK